MLSVQSYLPGLLRREPPKRAHRGLWRFWSQVSAAELCSPRMLSLLILQLPQGFCTFSDFEFSRCSSFWLKATEWLDCLKDGSQCKGDDASHLIVFFLTEVSHDLCLWSSQTLGRSLLTSGPGCCFLGHHLGLASAMATLEASSACPEELQPEHHLEQRHLH